VPAPLMSSYMQIVCAVVSRVAGSSWARVLLLGSCVFLCVFLCSCGCDDESSCERVLLGLCVLLCRVCMLCGVGTFLFCVTVMRVNVNVCA
jgi:hypothetical protein